MTQCAQGGHHAHEEVERIPGGCENMVLRLAQRRAHGGGGDCGVFDKRRELIERVK